MKGARKTSAPPSKGSTLGARLRWTRAYLGLSPEEFAGEIVTPNYYRRIKGRTIERWENNTSKEMRSSISLIGAIAARAGIDPSWLAFGEARVIVPLWAGFSYDHFGKAVPLFTSAALVFGTIILGLRIDDGRKEAIPVASP